MEFLHKISITCFFSSYLVVLIVELLRLLGRIPGRGLIVITMTTAGLVAHISYLLLRANDETGADMGLLASWTDWALLSALVLAICFFVFYLSRPDTIVSLFFLPPVMALIGLAVLVQERSPFSRDEAVGVWRSIHGLSMMVGSVSVLVGFLAGTMYVVQARRLKKHLVGAKLRLPTLETLGRLNRRSLVFSTALVGLGVLAGIIMNLNRWGHVKWTDGGVVLSTLLLVWLIVATVIEYWYEPANQARKAMYLTLASLGFLILAMIGVLGTNHGQSSGTTSLKDSAGSSKVHQVAWTSDPASIGSGAVR